MDDNTLIFPRCGLTYGDIKNVAQRANSIHHASKLLGVGKTHMYLTCQKYNLTDLFKHERKRQRKVTKEQVIELANEGYVREDVAAMLEISTGYLNWLIWHWKLSKEFKNRGGLAMKIKKEGYCS